MRSARYFAADHGIKLPSKKAGTASSDAEDAEDADEAPGSRGGQNRKADWFLHDDRDEDRNAESQNKQPEAWDTRATQTGFDSRRGGARQGSGRGEAGRTVPLVVQGTQWHYMDPEDNVQGPFDAKKLLNWIDLGYFGQTDLRVRQQGKEDFCNLSEALATIRKQAAGETPELHDRAQEPLRNTYNCNDDQPRGRGRGRSFGRGRRSQQDEADLLPVMPAGQKHPAEALLTPVDPNAEDQSQRHPNRRGAADASGGDQILRGRGRGVRGGRGAGGRGYGQDATGSQEQPRDRGAGGGSGGPAKGLRSKAAWALFTADSRSVAQEPVWRYIDPHGKTQGPFTAKEMHSWFEGNYLQTELPVCGMNKAISEADIPKSLYKSLGQLLRQAGRGQPFRPLQQKDIAPAPQQPASGAVLVVPRPANQQAQPQRAPRQRGPARQPTQEATIQPAVPAAAAAPAAEHPIPQAEAPPQDEQAAQAPEHSEGAGASSSAEPVPPDTAESSNRPPRSRADSDSSNDDCESVVARSNASDDESEEGEIRGRTAATDEDEDEVEPEEATAPSDARASAAQTSTAAASAASTRADQAPAAVGQELPPSGKDAVVDSSEDAGTSAEQAPAADDSVPAPGSDHASAGRAADSDAEMVPSTDTDQAPATSHESHASASTDQASSPAAIPAVEDQEYADAPEPDTDAAKEAAFEHADTKLSAIRGTPDSQQSEPESSQAHESGPTDAAAGGQPTSSGSATGSVPEDRRSAYEHADAKLSAIHKAGHSEHAGSHGNDAASSSSKQAQAPPVSTEAEDPMEIEEVTQAEAEAVSAPQEQHGGPGSPHEAQSPGIMQSMIGAAKSLLGGKPDEEADTDEKDQQPSETQDSQQHLDEPSQSYVIEPETSESEATESVTYSDHQADGHQQDNQTTEPGHSKAASVTSVDQDVADLQTGMENVRIEEPIEDTADDSKSEGSHINAQHEHAAGRQHAEPGTHSAATTD